MASTVNLVTNVITDTNLVQQVAAATSPANLQAVLNEASISGFSTEAVEQAFNNIVISRNSEAITSLFKDHSYYSCKRRLEAMGMETNPGEFDLIRDIYGAATDDSMGAEMDSAVDFDQAAEVLAAYGHYHISASFINVMVQYASLLDEEGIFTEEDYKEMEKCTFEERCTKYINKLQAIGVITGLRYGLHDSFETPYLIAIAGCADIICDGGCIASGAGAFSR